MTSSDGPWTIDRDHARGRPGEPCAAPGELAATTRSPPRVPTAAVRARPRGPGSITLHVQSARSVNAGAGLRPQGRPRQEVQVARQRRRHRRPGHLGGPGHRQVPAVDGPGRQHRPGLRRQLRRGPRPATPPASRRSSPRATRPTSTTARRSTTCPPEVPHLGDRRRLQDRRLALHGPRAGPRRSVVAMNPTPLPLTTLRLQVFNDNAPGGRDVRGGRGAGAAAASPRT